MQEQLPELMAQCTLAARQAGEIIRQNWSLPHSVRHKGRIDLVTETDLAVQKWLKPRLTEILPSAAFLGEEDPDGVSPDAPLCWIVDPVDGTTNFVHRIPCVCVSIGLCANGRPILGVVYAPMLGECFTAAQGLGAWLNDHRINVSSTESLQNAVVGTGFPYEVAPRLDAILGRLSRVLPATQGLRRLGSAALDLAYVACGRLDVFYEEELKPWDIAGGLALVSEAGGAYSAFDGCEYRFAKPLLADNGALHQAMLKLLN